MSGFYRGMEYLSMKINNAKDTKQSIIIAANSYDYIQKKVKEIEENALKDMQEQKPETIHFDPNEVQRIVLQDKDREER